MRRPTAWILGAGFSRALGGPLLGDLLSPATNNFVRSLYADNPRIGTAEPAGGAAEQYADERLATRLVRDLYRAGGEDARETKRLWSDAETFVDQLDAAALSDGPARKRMIGAVDLLYGELPLGPEQAVAWQRVRDSARRLIAAACCSFLKEADTTEERWQPYVSWAKELGPSDALVTFNYDRLLEELGQFEVIQPPRGSRTSSRGAEVANVFKLHGSVDWERTTEGGVTAYAPTQDREFALTCEGPKIGIATPGPSKRIAARELERIWAGALERIGGAEVVVFVGYRFPPSDAEAREKLLLALGTNASTHVELHIVLGPDRNKDVVRLEQLLRYAMSMHGREDITEQPRRGRRMDLSRPTFALTTHALFAEDFLSVFHRDLLWPKGLHVVSAVR